MENSKQMSLNHVTTSTFKYNTKFTARRKWTDPILKRQANAVTAVKVFEKFNYH